MEGLENAQLEVLLTKSLDMYPTAIHVSDYRAREMVVANNRRRQHGEVGAWVVRANLDPASDKVAGRR